MRRYILTVILTGMVMLISGQTGNNQLRERIYLQTDKQLYLAGEQVCMKLTTLEASHIPLVFSKVAYAELVGDSVARMQIKIALTNGAGEGRMILPTDLPTGYYRLIAYTSYMRNEGTDVFFEKNIGVVNTFQSGYYPRTAPPVSPSDNGTGSPQHAISIQTDKTAYPTRVMGELFIDGLPENIHTLSVIIAGKEMVLTDEPSFFQPNQQPVPTAFSEKYLPELEGHIITGSIIDNQTGKAADAGNSVIPVLTFPGKGLSIFTGQKNETGEVRFFTTGNYDTRQVATIVYHAGEKYRIDIHSPFVTRFAPKPAPDLYIDSACYDQLLERSIALQATRFFADDPDENDNPFEPSFVLKPTYNYPLDEYTRFKTMREVFIEFISSARFQRRNGVRELSAIVRKGSNAYYGTNPLVFLDGAPISNHEVVFNYDPLQVEYINVYNNLCLLGGYAFEGIIALQTYNGQMKEVTFDKSTQIIPYEGPQSRHPFFVPDYAVEKNRKSRTPDSRHTLLWNPDVPTAGITSIRLPFNTSDLTGEFQATIEIITNTGTFIFSTTCFQVE